MTSRNILTSIESRSVDVALFLEGAGCPIILGRCKDGPEVTEIDTQGGIMKGQG